MKKVVALVLAVILCLIFTLSFAEPASVVMSAIFQLEELANDGAYLQAVGADESTMSAIARISSVHGKIDGEWIIKPDMDYLLSLLSSSDTKLTEAGKNQLIRRTFSGIANLLTAKTGLSNLTACSYMTMSTAGEKTAEDKITLLTFDCGSPVIVAEWNYDNYCYYTVSFIPEEALQGADDTDSLENLFSDFLPKCTVTQIKQN